MKGSFLATTMVLLAGCSSGGGNGNDPTDVPDEGLDGNPLDNETLPPAPIVLTDVIHLLDEPAMSLLAPLGDEAAEAALPLGFAPSGGARSIDWEYVATANASLEEIEGMVWVRVTEPSASSGEGPLCAVSLIVEIHDAAGDNNWISDALCGRMPPVIQAEVYEIEIEPGTFLNAPIEITPGDVITFQFSRFAETAGVGDKIFLLSGSEEFDSFVRLPGLLEPVPAAPATP